MRFPSRLSALLLLAALCGVLLPASARAWWNNDWTTRKKLTIDLSPAGTPITDAVGTAAVLIRLHDQNFQFASAKSDGGDLRFVAADDKTLLPFQIEKYDALLDEAFIWVQVPDLKAGEVRTLWLYSGNPNAPAAADSRARLSEEEEEDDRVSVEEGAEVVDGPPAPLDVDSLQSKTKKELQDMLSKRGLPFSKTDSKSTLQSLLKATA